MPSIAAFAPGSFCWMELAAADQQGAKTFYSNLFGWVPADVPMGPDETYTLFQLDGADVAAAYHLKPATGTEPPHWNLYISVASADAAAAKAKSLGARVINAPFDVGEMGRMAVIQDPTGAVFAVWEPKSRHGVHVVCEQGAFCWADLSTPEPGLAEEFYNRLFGWKIHGGQGPDSEYLHIQNGSEMIGGIPPADQRDPHMPAHWLLYFQTADCDGTSDKAKQAGARIQVPPMSIPNSGRIAVLADPQGAVFALFETQNAA